MIKTKKYFKKQLQLDRYPNGQLAVFVLGYMKEPIAELSIMYDSVELTPNEFILKDYSENEEMTKELIEAKLITPTNRFIMVGGILCSICQIAS